MGIGLDIAQNEPRVRKFVGNRMVQAAGAVGISQREASEASSELTTCSQCLRRSDAKRFLAMVAVRSDSLLRGRRPDDLPAMRGPD